MRPLNFTVRSHLGGIQRREEPGECFGWLSGVRTIADSVVLRPSSFGATGVRVRPSASLTEGGARAHPASVRPRSPRRESASLVGWVGALKVETQAPWLAALGPHAHSGGCEGDF